MEEPGKSSLGPPPAAKTIRSYAARFDNESDEVKRSYAVVSWPESFARGDLPWEMAPTFLALLRWNHGIRPAPRIDISSPEAGEWMHEDHERRQAVVGQGIEHRPSVRVVRYLHELTRAVPESPFDWRLEMATDISAAEGAGTSDLAEKINRAVEARLAAETYYPISVWFPGDLAHPADAEGSEKED